jgi:Zn-dependent peptidase ImmA (M78 family)/transcriptional regulator with XRE-family HTH domain
MRGTDATSELETARALFDGERLGQARRLAGLLKADLAEPAEVTAAAIGQFESGTARPSVATLARLAEALHVPPAFFATSRPRFTVAEADAYFRSLRSTSTRDRARARAQVELLAEVVHALERHLRFPAVDLPVVEAAASPEVAAGLARAAWELGTGPVANVVALLEGKGVIVSRLPAATDELDAFSCFIEDRPFVVLVANKQAADRARFDAAHELFHLLDTTRPEPGDPQAERLAHRFAAEFLTPAASIGSELPTRLDWRRLAELKLVWGVSMSMLLRRQRDLGSISEPTFRRGMMEMTRRGWRRREPVDLGQPEKPELLSRALETAAAIRELSLPKLADELALYPDYLATFTHSVTLESRAAITVA